MCLCGRAPQSQQNYHRGFEYHTCSRKAKGADDADNLILLCHDCHCAIIKICLPPLGDLTHRQQFACKRLRTLLSTQQSK
jgi:hypothetical protein